MWFLSIHIFIYSYWNLLTFQKRIYIFKHFSRPTLYSQTRNLMDMKNLKLMALILKMSWLGKILQLSFQTKPLIINIIIQNLSRDKIHEIQLNFLTINFRKWICHQELKIIELLPWNRCISKNKKLIIFYNWTYKLWHHTPILTHAAKSVTLPFSEARTRMFFSFFEEVTERLLNCTHNQTPGNLQNFN